MLKPTLTVIHTTVNRMLQLLIIKIKNKHDCFRFTDRPSSFALQPLVMSKSPAMLQFEHQVEMMDAVFMK